MSRKRPGWRSAERTYNALTRELRKAAISEAAKGVTEEHQQSIRTAAEELKQWHRAYHPECKDLGPSTCPTWSAIHGLEKILSEVKR